MNNRWLRGFRDAKSPSSGGSGGGASADAEFVVLGLDSSLTAERVITAEPGVLTLTDNGPNSTLVIGVATNGIDFAHIQQISTNRLLGRSTAGTGDVEQLTIGTGLQLLAGSLSATGAGLVPAARSVFAGSGLIGGGTLAADVTLNVGANADGSIIVNADDIQVGILATDAQHGNRGGGSLHDLATILIAGFMSAADKSKLDAVTVANIPSTTEKAALVGTDGTPSGTNKYVTDSDPRLTGGGGTTVYTGTATMNFGIGDGASDLPQSSVVITGQAWVLSGSIISAWVAAVATADHDVDEVVAENISCYVGTIIPGTGFTIYGQVDEGSTFGDFIINWSGT